MSSFSKEFMNYFVAQYKNFSVHNNEIRFSTQHSEYTIGVSFGKSDGVFHYVIKLNHINGFAKDDHAILNLYLTDKGEYVSAPSISVTINGETFVKVLEWGSIAVGVVEGVVVGASGTAIAFALAPETLGASIAIWAGIEVIGVVVAGFLDGLFSLFGFLTQKVYNKFNDAGNVYFSQVIAHSQVRAVNAHIEAINHQSFDRLLKYDFNTFLNSIGHNHYELDNYEAKVTYRYKERTYYSWRHDVSVSYDNSSLILSGKIDGVRNHLHMDDYLVFLLTYDVAGNLIMAQGSIVMEHYDPIPLENVFYGQMVNGDGTIYVMQDSAAAGHAVILNENNVLDAFVNQAEDILKKLDGYHDFDKGRKNLPKILELNLNWLKPAVTRIEELELA